MKFSCVLLLCIVGRCASYSVKISPGPKFTFPSDTSSWSQLVLSDSLSGLVPGVAMTKQNLYVFPGMGGKPNSIPIPSGLGGPVGYLTPDHIYLIPSNGTALVAAQCNPSAGSCSFKVDSSLALNVPAGTEWKHVVQLPDGANNNIVLFFVSDGYLLRAKCKTYGAFQCFDPTIIPTSNYVSVPSYYSTAVSMVSPSLGYGSQGFLYIGRGSPTGASGAGQISQVNVVTLNATNHVFTMSPPTNLDVEGKQSRTMVWTSNNAPNEGQVNIYDEEFGNFYTFKMPYASPQSATSGAVVYAEAAAFYISTSGSSGYTVNYVYLQNQQVAAAPLSVSGETATTVAFMDGDLPTHLWVGRFEGGKAALSAFVLDPLLDGQQREVEQRPRTRAFLDFGGACVDKDMAPTCWKSCSSNPTLCGPAKQCPNGNGCYVLGESIDCCDFCPPEWSQNC